MNTRDYFVNKYLSNDIRYHNDTDDVDLPDYWIDRSLHGLDYREFSECNQYYLLNELIKAKEKSQVIVEIGVARINDYVPFEHTSTMIMINNKKDDAIYLGIDIEDKKFLEDKKPNVHTLKAKSEDYSEVSKKFVELGIRKIDFLFIDGWHSVNQVIDELFYVDLVPSGGIIGYHDTNYHPGPSRIINALNPDLFEVHKHCVNKIDWGVGFAVKK